MLCADLLVSRYKVRCREGGEAAAGGSSEGAAAHRGDEAEGCWARYGFAFDVFQVNFLSLRKCFTQALSSTATENWRETQTEMKAEETNVAVQNRCRGVAQTEIWGHVVVGFFVVVSSCGVSGEDFTLWHSFCGLAPLSTVTLTEGVWCCVMCRVNASARTSTSKEVLVFLRSWVPSYHKPSKHLICCHCL